MRHKIDDNGVRNIYTEDGENEREVLQAIVVASFETASTVGMGWFHFKSDQTMTGEDADNFITLPPEYGDIVVDMDYVQGRQCKTIIAKKGEGHFTLNGRLFMRDRGVPEPMLNKAKELLIPGTNQNDSVSKVKAQMYKGENLTLRLREYGFERRVGESDWDFRKRVFPDLYAKDPDRAAEFLFGAGANEWSDVEKFLYLTHKSTDLKKFVAGFPMDPAKMRQK